MANPCHRQKLRVATVRQSASAPVPKTYHRQSPSEARQHVLCGAGEPHNADGDAAVYETDERVQQKAGKPRAHGRALRALVELRPHPQDAADEPGDGGGDPNAAVVDGGRGSADRRARGSSNWCAHGRLDERWQFCNFISR